jgi:hypothetical protein
MPKTISIWFFAGVIMLLYGVLIGITGVYSLSHPAEHPVVLANLHIDIWWGVILTLIGAFYCWKFSPFGKE